MLKFSWVVVVRKPKSLCEVRIKPNRNKKKIIIISVISVALFLILIGLFYFLLSMNDNKSNHIISMDEKRFDSDNRSEDYQAYENLVKETIDYESLEVTHHDDMRQVDEIVNLIVETVMCKNDKILIASNWYPASLVKKKFLMLTYSHIEYVLHCMSGNTTKVKNIKKYLLAALFNAPSTMNGYYQAEVNHDMPGLAR